MVGQGRLELPTSRLSGVCSNHLSYWPECGSKAVTDAGWDPRPTWGAQFVEL
jgi:hypothetical protein